MKHILVLLVALVLVVPVFGETWKNVTLVDGMCAAKAKDNPDKHTAACTKHCAKDGDLGVLTADGTFLKFDAKGKEMGLAALDKSGKKDHLRVNVEGERSGDLITVKNIAFVK